MARHPDKKVTLTKADLATAFDGPWGDCFPPVLTVQQAADLLGIKKNTIYHKSSEGALDGTFAKVAGKLRFWRDKLVKKAFGGEI